MGRVLFRAEGVVQHDVCETDGFATDSQGGRSGAVRLSRTVAAALRHGEPSVFSRIADDALILDPRTLLEGDLEGLIAALCAVTS